MRLAIQLLVSALLLLPGLAPAQVQLTITGGQEKALPVAIVPLQVTQGLGTPDTDIAGVVRNDLRRTGLFNPLAPENFISRPSSSAEVRYRNWRALGADYLMVGSIAPANNGTYEIRVAFMDVYGGEVLINKVYDVARGALRRTAHSISNDIFRELFDRPGGFNSSLVYVQSEGEADDRQFRLIYADADGYRPQTILSSSQPILSPAWSPQSDRLAYVSFEDGRSEIFIQSVATGDRRKVASFKGINSAPAFSPDGRRLAMTLSRDGNPDIHILDLDTGRTRRLTDHYGIDTEPVWTPDGKHVLFTSDRSGSPQIYRVPVSGGEPGRLTFEGAYNASPDLSPNGRLLAMVQRDDRGFHIAVLDLESGLTRVLTDGRLDESPSFSPSGATVVYTRVDGGRTDLATISIHGGAGQSLKQFNGDVREPAWSPLK